MLRVARFLRGFVREASAVVDEREIVLADGDSAIPASYLRPPTDGPLPGWIVLHGVTVPGREHPVLTRFARALAGSGAAVLIPEVPAWKRLELDPVAGDRSIAAAVDQLRSDPGVEGDINLVGFSFGATQALMSAAKPGIREAVRSVVAFGGYCDLGRTLTCMMTGEHEWMGVRHCLDPDPYGRWIIAANYIDAAPEFSHMKELKWAARELAIESGRRGVYAAEREYDPLKRQLGDRLPPDQKQIWDVLAPPSGVRPPRDLAHWIADKLIVAVLEEVPALDPRSWLPELDQRIVLAHGYDDRLIPYTESLRLRAALPPSADATVTITRLFAHSREAERLGWLAYPREVGRYLALLRRALTPC